MLILYIVNYSPPPFQNKINSRLSTFDDWVARLVCLSSSLLTISSLVKYVCLTLMGD